MLGSGADRTIIFGGELGKPLFAGLLPGFEIAKTVYVSRFPQQPAYPAV